MRIKKASFTLIVAATILNTVLLVGTPCGFSFPIDLTEATGGFIASDPGYVTFGPDINAATLFEDEFFGSTFLANDPFLNDPGVFVPANVSTLSLDLDFFTTGSDSFQVKLLDPLGGGPLFDMFHDGIVLGPGSYQYRDVSIDLIGLNLLETTIGFEFYLESNFGDTSFDSVLQISNVVFNEKISPVPEPSSIFLIGSGLLCIVGFGRSIPNIQISKFSI